MSVAQLLLQLLSRASQQQEENDLQEDAHSGCSSVTVRTERDTPTLYYSLMPRPSMGTRSSIRARHDASRLNASSAHRLLRGGGTRLG